MSDNAQELHHRYVHQLTTYDFVIDPTAVTPEHLTNCHLSLEAIINDLTPSYRVQDLTVGVTSTGEVTVFGKLDRYLAAEIAVGHVRIEIKTATVERTTYDPDLALVGTLGHWFAQRDQHAHYLQTGHNWAEPKKCYCAERPPLEYIGSRHLQWLITSWPKVLGPAPITPERALQVYELIMNHDHRALFGLETENFGNYSDAGYQFKVKQLQSLDTGRLHPGALGECYDDAIFIIKLLGAYAEQFHRPYQPTDNVVLAAAIIDYADHH